MTGKFRKKRGGESHKPIGDWLENCLEDIHEFDGHRDDDLSRRSRGKIILKSELDSLYVQNGIEGAADDVSGATLDPDMVRADQHVEVGFFKDMKVYAKFLRSD